jgi:hypothetical protein
MNIRAAALILALAGAAAPALAAEQFNLDCKGSARTIIPVAMKDETAPYEHSYRVDLDAKKWCVDACRDQMEIVRSTPTEIILEERKVDTPRESVDILNQISRETGAHLTVAASGVGRSRAATYGHGQCEKAAFSGFPKVETKF